ncbi:MAG: IS4 family transposase [Verrucomicrobiae bacterium]|nr:IS4 family transposase [Verrucomicrobiae bacterium]
MGHARPAKSLPVGYDNTQHLSLGVMALCFPASAVQQAIEACGRVSHRVRDLPAAVVVYYVIGLSLFSSAGYESVLRWLLCGLQWLDCGQFRVSSKAALSKARQRLGEAPMRRLFDQLARPLRDPALQGSWWRTHHVVVLDGSTLALQDTPSNDSEFGRSTNQHGRAAWPLARFVALVEAGTHLIFRAELGRYKDSEIVLAEKVIDGLGKGMLCLADRLFPGLGLWKKATATGAHLLWRAKVGLKLIPLQRLADGSWLALWKSATRGQEDAQGVTVRVIEYRLKGGDGQTYRLLTSLLDPRQAPAHELAALYPQRWEIELAIKEGKHVLRCGQITLRSKIPELVRQEFWGLLMAHHIVRKMMARAALDAGIDPDLLSYKNSVEIIRSCQTGPVLAFSP